MTNNALTCEQKDQLRRHYSPPNLGADWRIPLVCDELERCREALKHLTTEAEALFAMVNGECPSLLEDHHQYGSMVTALEIANTALNPASETKGEAK